MKYNNVIWEGRFQPIHKGHVSYVGKLLERAHHLWIFVVENEVSANVLPASIELPVPEFSREVDEHHSGEKNPLPFWMRLRLVTETLADEFPGAPITVWGGRRLDLAWSFYDRALPPDRIFLTPERDTFEDAKAKAWNQLGQRVERVNVDDLPKISATEVRDRLEATHRLEELLPSSTIRLLKNFGIIGNHNSP